MIVTVAEQKHVPARAPDGPTPISGPLVRTSPRTTDLDQFCDFVSSHGLVQMSGLLDLRRVGEWHAKSCTALVAALALLSEGRPIVADPRFISRERIG